MALRMTIPAAFEDTLSTPEQIEWLYRNKEALLQAGANIQITRADGRTIITAIGEGFSPTVEVEEIAGGHQVTITDGSGPHVFDVMDGVDGDDGVSPTVTITSITGGHRVVITDEDHPSGQSFDVMDGVDGSDGASISVKSTTAVEGGVNLVLTDGTTDTTIFLSNGPQGLTGPQGPKGATGATGATGAQGPAGQNGANGQDGITPSITCSATADNTSSDNPTVVVTKSGTTAAPTYAFAFSGLKGAKGDTGATGATGPAGQDGTDGTDGTDGDRGGGWFECMMEPTASQTYVGMYEVDRMFIMAYDPSGTTPLVLQEGDQIMYGYNRYAFLGQESDTVYLFAPVSMRGAQGEQGEQGPAGQDGTDGTDGQDGVTPVITATATADATHSANPSVTVTKSGTDAAPSFAFAFSGLQGEQGPAGADGEDGVDGQDGAAATIAVGTVTTGAAGSSATVTNVGTSSAAVFDFSIPQGAAGAQGPAGQGVPTGGTTGQVLAKASGTNYDCEWVTPSSGGGGDNSGFLNTSQNGVTITLSGYQSGQSTPVDLSGNITTPVKILAELLSNGNPPSSVPGSLLKLRPYGTLGLNIITTTYDRFRWKITRSSGLYATIGGNSYDIGSGSSYSGGSGSTVDYPTSLGDYGRVVSSSTSGFSYGDGVSGVYSLYLYGSGTLILDIKLDSAVTGGIMTPLAISFNGDGGSLI